jgi:hypothetical protein
MTLAFDAHVLSAPNDVVIWNVVAVIASYGAEYDKLLSCASIIIVPVAGNPVVDATVRSLVA